MYQLLLPLLLVLLGAGPLSAQLAPAGDPPPFLRAVVAPIEPAPEWRAIYAEVEACAARRGDFDAVRWSVMAAPLRGPKGPTFAFTYRDRIVLVRGDTTYLRHEMLHHVLATSGWEPRPLAPGEHHTIAELHPAPLFAACAGDAHPEAPDGSG